jgi:hypothetical protein
MFITEFTRVLYLYLSWARSIQSKTLNPISKRSILSIHIRLGLPSGLFPSVPNLPQHVHNIFSPKIVFVSELQLFLF